VRRLLRLALVAVVVAEPASASAQTLMIAARDTAVVAAGPGATITTALRITNNGAGRIALTPRLTLPTGWSAPMGTRPFALAAGQTDSWLIGLRVPTRAPAGRYVIGVTAEDSASHSLVRDSLVVEVSVRRGLELSLTNRPTYAVSGSAYRASFLLRNRGNVRTTVTIRGTSALGGSVALDSTRITMAAGASLSLGARVETRTKSEQAQDDVLELYAADQADSTNAAQASARVTIVQEANMTEPLHRVATQVRLRAANASAGVSPYEISGGGQLRDGGSEQVSFVFRGAPGTTSQFGDQDEYRIELRGSNYTARAGDALYRVSSLSSAGQMGFGSGIDMRAGSMTVGGFAQRFRFQPGSSTERGAYVAAAGADLFAAPQLTLSGMSRTGGLFAGKVIGTALTLTPLNAMTIELEGARSTGAAGDGAASTARVTGGDRVHYDVGHIAADDRFAGVTRGAVHDYATVSARLITDLQLNASTGSHHSNGAVFGLFAPQDFHSSTVGVDYQSRVSLQYSSLTKSSFFSATRYDESLSGLFARASQTFGLVRTWAGAGSGIASSALAGRHGYHEFSAGINADVAGSSISFYGEASKGMAVTRGADNVLTIGSDGRVRITSGTYITYNGFQTSSIGGDHSTQLDAGLSQLLSTGSTVSLHVRLLSHAIDPRSREVAFVEYSMPLKVPVGRVHSAGRVRGRVVDQETGLGVAGTLVRLGPQAAITDGEGRVAFAGLPAGEYRLAIAQQATLAATVFTGNPTVRIDSARMAPTTFSLAVERAGIVAGTVRRMSVARTGLDAVADSLADAGALGEVAVALVGVRDTLYTTTDLAGAYRFAEVSSGSYVLRIVTEAPSGTRWEPSEIDVSVKPALTRQVAFRLIPRRRAVQMIPSDNPRRQ
jgi:hypothetical protein